jgi:hypothetical protein
MSIADGDTDTVLIAAGDSLETGYDEVFDFTLGTGSGNTGVDRLNLVNTNFTGSGIITTAAGATFNEIFSYLSLTLQEGNTVGFVVDNNTYIYQDSNDVNFADTVIELLGVQATSLSNTGLEAGSVWMM